METCPNRTPTGLCVLLGFHRCSDCRGKRKSTPKKRWHLLQGIIGDTIDDNLFSCWFRCKCKNISISRWKYCYIFVYKSNATPSITLVVIRCPTWSDFAFYKYFLIRSFTNQFRFTVTVKWRFRSWIGNVIVHTSSRTKLVTLRLILRHTIRVKQQQGSSLFLDFIVDK